MVITWTFLNLVWYSSRSLHPSSRSLPATTTSRPFQHYQPSGEQTHTGTLHITYHQDLFPPQVGHSSIITFQVRKYIPFRYQQGLFPPPVGHSNIINIQAKKTQNLTLYILPGYNTATTSRPFQHYQPPSEKMHSLTQGFHPNTTWLFQCYQPPGEKTHNLAHIPRVPSSYHRAVPKLSISRWENT